MAATAITACTIPDAQLLLNIAIANVVNRLNAPTRQQAGKW